MAFGHRVSMQGEAQEQKVSSPCEKGPEAKMFLLRSCVVWLPCFCIVRI